MANTDDPTKTHYICQTYVDGSGQSPLKVDKLFQYTSAQPAIERAEREAQRDTCAGADAYTVTEDTASGEVSAPEFLVRFGRVPDHGDA